jgi:hypothetical protein
MWSDRHPVTRVAIPALIVMIAVVSLVGAAQWNRSGAPRLSITLTERELPMLGVPVSSTGEEPGVRLQVAYEYRLDPLDSRNWLPESRLREIGFPFNVPVGSPDAAGAYDHVPPRVAWVALEFDGPAWREIERRRALTPEETRHFPHAPSRLVPVDAAADFETLHRRYPSGHLLVRGVIALGYVGSERGGPLVYGLLREIVPTTIAVPAHLRPVFDGLPYRAPATEELPRYEAQVSIGGLGLPYLSSARTLP